MTLLDRVLGRQPQAASMENPQYPLTSTSLLTALGITNTGVPRVTETTALNMPAVWRAVNVIASSSASLPLHPYRVVQSDDDDEGSIRAKVVSGNAAALLDKPHPDLTPFELWELVYTHLGLWGNSYLQKVRSRDLVVRELWPITPSRVRAGRASDHTKIYEIDGERGLTDYEILHIPGFGYDGVVGLTPIGVARKGITLSLAAEEFGSRLFSNGSMAGGLLTTAQHLKSGQADALQAQWQARHAGLDNAHKIAVLDSGAKFQPLTINPDDAQFLQTRVFQIEEISRMYGVPPHMLMSLEKTTSWGTGVEQQSLNFVRYSLRAWLTRVEQRVTKILKPEPVYAKYSLEGLLRGDSAGRATFYTAMLGSGVYSVNEVRALEELPPVEGGDTRYRPLNMGEIGAPDPATDDPAAEPAE